MNITTSKLFLRTFISSDLNNLHNIMSNENIASLAGFSKKSTLVETNSILNIFLNEPSDTLWAITLKSENKAIGWIELHSSINSLDTTTKELGFVLYQDYWGLGLMPEAINALIDYSFNTLHINKLICSHFENNKQSKRVIEKCGFKFNSKQNDKLYYYLINI